MRARYSLATSRQHYRTRSSARVSEKVGSNNCFLATFLVAWIFLIRLQSQQGASCKTPARWYKLDHFSIWLPFSFSLLLTMPLLYHICGVKLHRSRRQQIFQPIGHIRGATGKIPR